MSEKHKDYKQLVQPADALSADEILYVLEEVRRLIFVGLYKEARKKFDECFPSSLDLTISERTREYIAATPGWFELHMIYAELHLATKQEKGAAKACILRELEKGNIEKYGKKRGVYRKPDYECEEIDWINADDTTIKIILPLDLHKHVALYGGDMILVAGKWNAGKSAWLMEMARLNLDIWKMDFLTSEMKGPRFKKRMRLMREHLGTDWDKFNEQVRVRGRSGGFHDVIEAQKLTMIDYLHLNEDFFRLGTHLKEIEKKFQKQL